MTALSDPVNEFTGNSRFGLIRCIGSGGIGLVYEAVDHEYNTRIALKTLQRLSGDALLRFKNEFRLLQGIHHNNLVQLGELFEEHGHWFFTMELLHGTDFMDYVAGTEPRSPRREASDSATVTLDSQNGDTPGQESVLRDRQSPHRFDETRLRAALKQLATGLHALHQSGMVHRDIKPGNVMVSGDRVVLLDFGLVSEERPWHRYSADHGMVLGTPSYMAPEQAAAQAATPASDWYAVGVMLYEALTGCRPFTGHSGYVILAKQQTDPLTPSQRHSDGPPIPPDLNDLCMQLLRRDPAVRPTGPQILKRLAAAPARAVPVRLGTTTTDGQVALVGRTAELVAMRETFAQCRPGHPVVSFVHGVSGMGKTALIEHFAREVRDLEQALVLRGRCYEREAVPYKAFDGVIDALSQYLQALRSPHPTAAAQRAWDNSAGTSADNASGGPGSGIETLAREQIPAVDPDWEADLRVLLAHHGPVLARLFPVLESALTANAPQPLADQDGIDEFLVPDSDEFSDVSDVIAMSDVLDRDGDAVRDPSELRQRAFAALKALFGHLAKHRPVVVIIDDLQWGDLDSAALLSEFLAPPNAPGLLLVAAFRSEEAASPVVTSLRASAQAALGPTGSREIEVGPLSARDCRDLAMAIWRRIQRYHSPLDRPDARPDAGRSEAMARIAIRESAGSPLFVGELIRYLAARWPHAPITAEVESGHITLDRVLVERRRQLPTQARALLDVIAVAGRPIAQGVALSAAGLDGAERGVLDALRTGHFVRTRGPGLHDAVEIYHDRIREAVLAHIDASALRGHHGWLALALEDWGVKDAEMLATHYDGAGRHDRAAAYALQAADNAERVLAFDRAAHMYRLALAAPATRATDRRDLFICLGSALGNAGRGADAAAAYLAAAAIAIPADGDADASHETAAPRRRSASLPVPNPMDGSRDTAVECKRLAAEQLLRSGQVADGMALLAEVLAACHLHVPQPGRQGYMLLLFHKAVLRLRGLGYHARPAAEIDGLKRQRIDVCWSGAVGLSMVDIVLGADFAIRCLLLALRQGDETRIGRALALQAAHLAIHGAQSAMRATNMTRTAAAVARRIKDPLTTGLCMLAQADVALHNGRWKRASKRCAHATQIFREQCIGAAWEASTALTHRCFALYFLGDWHVLRKIVPTAIRQARDQGDLYTVAGLASYEAYTQLCVDDVAGARRAMEAAAILWDTSSYHLQRYLRTVGHFQVEMYAGNMAAAWARITAEVPAIRRSPLIRAQIIDVETAHSLARGALGMAAASRDTNASATQNDTAGASAGDKPARAIPGRADIDQFLQVATREARYLERTRVPWALAMAVLLHAGVAALSGERDRAIALLKRAVKELTAADMSLFAASAAWQRGYLLGDVQGRDIRTRAEAAMRRRDIANPAAFAGMLAPGFSQRP